jgi:hypothetical protein
MPNTPNTSIIPKRGPAKRAVQSASRQVYVFTLASYVFFFATLIATAGTFFYERYVAEQLSAEVTALNASISGFNETDMNTVRELNLRLKQAQQRLANTVSLVSLFTAIEESTAQTAKISEFSMVRQSDTTFEIKSKIETDSFDSAMFQRNTFRRNPVFETVVVKDVTLGEAGEDADSPSDSFITFAADLSVPLSAVPYLLPQNIQSNTNSGVQFASPDLPAVSPVGNTGEPETEDVVNQASL